MTAEDVVVYSTHYRRTFQSALAFLYSFLSLDDLHKVSHCNDGNDFRPVVEYMLTIFLMLHYILNFIR